MPLCIVLVANGGKENGSAKAEPSADLPAALAA